MKRFLVLLLVLLPSVLWADPSTPTKRYPPYPDVWDWIAPVSPKLRTTYFQADLQSNGDVRVSYLLKSEKPTDIEDTSPQGGAHGFTFFERQVVQPAEDVKAYFSQPWEITLASGHTLQSLGSFKSTSGCFDRIDNRLVLGEIVGDKSRTLTRRALVYLLEKPRRFKSREGCHDDGKAFTYQVEAIPARLVSLEDGTFLAVDGEHGLVVRFDEQFRSKSALLNQRIFVIDMDAVWLAGDYGSHENEDLSWQKFNDALYQYVKNLKGKK